MSFCRVPARAIVWFLGFLDAGLRAFKIRLPDFEETQSDSSKAARFAFFCPATLAFQTLPPHPVQSLEVVGLLKMISVTGLHDPALWIGEVVLILGPGAQRWLLRRTKRGPMQSATPLPRSIFKETLSGSTLYPQENI